MKSFLRLLALSLPLLSSASIKGYNYFGLETSRKDLDCTWAHPAEFYISKLHDLGFNYLRLPFSAEYVNESNWGKMDDVFSLSEKYDFDILLDYHRTHASHQGDWSETNMHDFIDTWITIIDRYKNNYRLKSIGVYNEYQGTNATFWNGILHEAVERLEKLYPGRFVYLCGGVRWGGDIHDIDLEDLPYRSRIKYESHKYIFSSGKNITKDLEWSLGPYQSTMNKVIIAEWGFFSDRPDQVRWAMEFIEYLKNKKIHDNFFWTAVANSGDTGGLYSTDCETFDQKKYDILKTLWEE